MALTTYGVTDAGFRAPRGEELLTILQDSLSSALGPGLVFEADTVEGVFAGVLAAVMGDLSEGSMQGLADALDVNNARGAMLENLCALFGLRRQLATPSLAQLTPTLSAPAAFVGVGTRFATTPADGQPFQVWEALEDTALTGAPGETIPVRCIQPGPGPVQAPAAAINRILDVVAGLTAVTNADPAAPGLPLQGDRDLRQQRLRLLQAGGRGTLGAIYAAAVRALPAGYFVGVVENTSDADVLIDATPVAAHGHAVVVYPEPTAADADLLRLAILQTRPAGGATSGDQTAATTDPETGYTATVGFYIAQQQPIGVQVEVAGTEPGFITAEVEANAEAAIRAHFATLRVGDDVRLLNLYRVLAGVDGLTTASVQLNNDGLGYALTDVVLGEFHIAVVDEVVFL